MQIRPHQSVQLKDVEDIVPTQIPHILVYIAQKCDQGDRLVKGSALFTLFFGYKTFPSPQKVSGNSKNSWR